MLFNPVYLYANKLDVFTSPSDAWSTERYRKVYNRNLKIYRGVDNRIDIQVRNSDQKASNVVGSTLVFNLVSKDTKNLVLQKDFTSMDLATGKVTIILTDTELLGLDNGYYQYSVIKEVRSTIDSTDYKVTSKIPLYVDSQYGTVGTLEISGDVYGDVENSLVVDSFSYTNPATAGDVELKFYESSIIDAQPNLSTGIHTFQFYHTDYRGSVTIQGSLDAQGATPKKWVDIVSVNLETETYKNVTGKWNWFRIKHVPARTETLSLFSVTQTIYLDYEVSIITGGKGYRAGDVIVIPGNTLGGELMTNDLTVTVVSADITGRIDAISWAGTSYNGVRTFLVNGDTTSVGTLDKVLYR